MRAFSTSAAMSAALVLACTSYVAVAQAPRGGRAAPAGQSAIAPPAAARPLPLRTRLGVLTGISMQKTDLMLGVTYDFGAIMSRVRLVGDLSIGLRLTEVTLEPMAGIHVPFELRNLPGLEIYFGGLAGANVTLMRGSIAVAIPLRLALGLHYRLQPGLGLGVEASAETGPLIAPFVHTYAAGQVCALVGWAF